jgi:hypothetical protein
MKGFGKLMLILVEIVAAIVVIPVLGTIVALIVSMPTLGIPIIGVIALYVFLCHFLNKIVSGK